MELRPILVFAGLLAAGAVLAQAYTWTDENGVVHYSDRPHPDAKQIQLPERQGPRPQPTRRAAPASTDDAVESQAPQAAFRYESLEIASPDAEETLWNIGGVLDVSLDLSPGLQSGHQVRVYFDGNMQTVSGTSFQLEEVYRGIHNIQVEVIDETGTPMIRSSNTRFYVQQNTVF